MENEQTVNNPTPQPVTTTSAPDPPIRAQPSSNPKPMTKRSDLTLIADHLEDEYDIGHHLDRPRNYRRYAVLRLNELYNALVGLYTKQFHAHWHMFKRLVDSHFTSTEAAPGWQHLARVYISHWIWDTYVTIRRSVIKTSATAFIQQFHQEVAPYFDRYDPFLQHVNSVIRPTHIQLSLEDTLYIPMYPDAQWDAAHIANPWSIPEYNLDEVLLLGAFEIMDQKSNNWELLPLTSDTLGRPMWLLDWNRDAAYAWFPEEGNYTREDLIAPYIIGIPITPRLAPRDVDAWQPFETGNLPNRINVLNYRRVDPRQFFGAAEYTTLQHERYDATPIIQAYVGFQAASKKRKTPSALMPPPGPGGSSSSSVTLEEEPMDEDPPINVQEFTYYRFRLITWCNCARVILRTTPQNVNRAFRSFLFPSK
ncbi:ORF1 [Amaranthus cryptic virus 2]|nr:ORF1 [Amaranthus cryptic virus 2]